MKHMFKTLAESFKSNPLEVVGGAVVICVAFFLLYASITIFN